MYYKPDFSQKVWHLCVRTHSRRIFSTWGEIHKQNKVIWRYTNQQLTIIGDIPGVAGAGNNIIDLAGSASEICIAPPSNTKPPYLKYSQTAERGEEWMLDVPAPMGWSFVMLSDGF